MDIRTTLEQYKSFGQYFSNEYELENEILNGFFKNNPILSEIQTKDLLTLLKHSSDSSEKYFAADLLYLYKNFDPKLFYSLINTAIYFEDPSFNRLFITPCIRSYGYSMVINELIKKFQYGTAFEREGVKRLMYWIRPDEDYSSLNELKELIRKVSNMDKL